MKSVQKPAGKKSQEQVLPNRMAMQQLTKGDPAQRSMNNYAKKSPAGLAVQGPSIFGYGGGSSGGSNGSGSGGF